MADHSAIEWTDATWNPTTGCTKISPGCAHCYIERTPAFRIAGTKFVRGKTDITIFHDRLAQPLHWRKPRRVFVNSLSDLFHEDISDTFIDRVFGIMACSGRHTFQVLTKRADRMQAYVRDRAHFDGREFRCDAIQRAMDLCEDVGTSPYAAGLPAGQRWAPYRWPLPNVWLGVSVENQHFADERIPLLLETPAAVRFISAEPLLGPLDLRRLNLGVQRTGYGPRLIERDALTPWETQYHGTTVTACKDSINRGARLAWVIVGGESGPGARRIRLEWIRSIRDQCDAAGVAYFFKQWGGPTAKSGGRELDGREWNGIPEARA